MIFLRVEQGLDRKGVEKVGKVKRILTRSDEYFLPRYHSERDVR